MQDQNLLMFFEKLINKDDELNIIKLIFDGLNEEQILEKLLEKKVTNCD